MTRTSAVKLDLVDQLDPRQHEPETVKVNIRRLLDEGSLTLKEIERFTSYKVPTLSQHLNNKYEGDKDRLDQVLVRFWKSWISKHSIVKTQAAEEIFAVMEWAWKRKKIAMIVGDNGRGKTTAVQSFCSEHSDDTVYIVLDATTRVGDFFDALAASLGIEAQMSGPASFRKAAIIRALQRKPRMIVIDEADEIRSRILSTLRTIWADNEGRCAIVLVGTGELERMLRLPANHLRYMDTRISLRLRVKEMDEADAYKLINCYPHSLERAEMKELCHWANKSSRTQGGTRALANLMSNAYDLMQQYELDEINTDCIERAKALM